MRTASPQGLRRSAERLAGSPAPTLSTPCNPPRHSATCGRRSADAASADVDADRSRVTARRRGQRGRGRRGRRTGPLCRCRKRWSAQRCPCYLCESSPCRGKWPQTSLPRPSGQISPQFGWGTGFPLVGHSFLVAEPDLIGDSGSEAFLPPSDVQTGNACDPLRAGEAPKRVINTGMTVKTGRLTD